MRTVSGIGGIRGAIRVYDSWAHAMRPYVIVYEDDHMQMVWHHDIFIQFDFLPNLSRLEPFLTNYLPQRRQPRRSVDDLRQDRFSLKYIR